MPGPDQINEQKLRDIKNLNQEDLEENICSLWYK